MCHRSTAEVTDKFEVPTLLGRPVHDIFMGMHLLSPAMSAADEPSQKRRQPTNFKHG